MKSVSICLLLLFTMSTDAADRKSRGRGAWAWATSNNAWAVTETAKPAAPTAPAASECTDALAEVNAKRAERGLPPFKHDAQLTQAALACARERASRGIHGHLESDFVHLPAGVSTNGVAAGCAALEPSWGWQSCCWDDPGYSTAGAAWVESGGLRYMHIFVSGQSATTQSTPQVYQQQSTASAGTCSDGSCGVQSTRRGIFRRR